MRRFPAAPRNGARSTTRRDAVRHSFQRTVPPLALPTETLNRDPHLASCPQITDRSHPRVRPARSSRVLRILREHRDAAAAHTPSPDCWPRAPEFTSPTRQRGTFCKVFPRLRFGLVWTSKWRCRTKLLRNNKRSHRSFSVIHCYAAPEGSSGRSSNSLSSPYAAAGGGVRRREGR